MVVDARYFGFTPCGCSHCCWWGFRYCTIYLYIILIHAE